MSDATPVQAVARPILCNPYDEPNDHWLYDRESGIAHQAGHRRPAGYHYKTERVGASQQLLYADEQWDELTLVNRLRADVKRWRETDYRGASNVTRDLLRHWARPDRFRRLFFCQREAVETIIWLSEIAIPDRWSRTQFKNFQVGPDDLKRLLKGERPAWDIATAEFFPRLIDQPLDPNLIGLRRFGCKMATGSGKTVVMAMLIAWAFCNRGKNPESTEFPAGVLVCCPNLTIKERLQVLRPEHPQNYYAQFDIVPQKYRDLLNRGKVLVENWHKLALASPHAEGDANYRVVKKGDETPLAYAQRVLGDLFDRLPIMVLNDEGHHCWRPRPAEESTASDSDEELVGILGDRKEEEQKARVWLGGLDRINNCGALGDGVPAISHCIDLSATPFYLKGSGYPEGSPFPWLVSDFGLVDAIETGIVKIPRLPVVDTTGRPDPAYFRLWKDHIMADLRPGERLPGRNRGKPKPPVVYRKAQGALAQLASQWKERFEQIQNATPGQEKSPPVLIVVCDNTDIAEEFYRRISGEHEEPIVTAEEAAEVLEGEDDETPRAKRTKSKSKKSRTVYGPSEIFPEFANTPERKYTIRIDSKLLAEAESDEPGKTKSDAAEQLRRIVSTVGKPGEPGEHVRCVVSVAMLTEGWDANNVTHILGVRAFGSQLLCEQVVGRGLRRMDYTPDPKSGKLTEEYVDVYGIPFSVIPYKGRPINAKAPEDKPKQHVKAMPERAHMRMEFPVVEGYVFALRRNLITCDIDGMEPLELEPHREPVATFLRMATGYAEGAAASVGSPFSTVRQDREGFYKDNHIETIKFTLAKHVLDRLLAGVGDGNGMDKKARVLRLQSRHQLFPQVFRFVDQYVRRKVHRRDCPIEEIALEHYGTQIIERLVQRIEPDDAQGEPPLLPVLNRLKPIGSTDDVDFKTVKACRMTEYSHVNQVVLDTQTWEASAAFYLEEAARSGIARYYVRNEGLGLSIPYEFLGPTHGYEPDFLVRLDDGTTLVLEVKGFEDAQDRAKHEGARRWIEAVNNWGKLGQWRFHVCRDPQRLGRELRSLLRPHSPAH